MNSERLVPPSMLYRFAIPCRRLESDSGSSPVALDEQYAIPDIGQLNRVTDEKTSVAMVREMAIAKGGTGQHDHGRKFADVRVAWSDAGLFLDIAVDGKQQSLWCRRTQMTESDRVMVWVDTRDTHNVHRATRFCHWFLALPTEGRDGDPSCSMLRINRAREDPPTMNQCPQPIDCRVTERGYRLQLHIPGGCLTGWNPQEHKKLGFNYAVVDRELGWQSLDGGPDWPGDEDPSLWQTLELTGER